MSEITTQSTKIFTPAKIEFKFCAILGFPPLCNSMSAIIINGNRTTFLNDAVKFNFHGKPSEDFGSIACTDDNNFLDCQAVGKIVGRTFAYQVDCGE